MPNETLDQMADRLAAGSTTAFNNFQTVLQGTGPSFQEFQSIHADARLIDQLGSKAAANIRDIHEDELIPADVKQVRQARIEEATDALLKDIRTGVLKRFEALESRLMEQIKPAPQTDPNKSILARQELEMLVQADTQPAADNPGLVESAGNRKASTVSMLQTLHNIAVSNPEHAAEILGPWGQAKMAAAHESQHIRDLHKNVVRTLAKVPGGPNAAAKAALNALPQAKGHVEGYVQAAQMRLDPLRAKAPDTIGPPTRMSTITSSADTQSKVRFKQ
jgi:hypothetical protein